MVAVIVQKTPAPVLTYSGIQPDSTDELDMLLCKARASAWKLYLTASSLLKDIAQQLPLFWPTAGVSSYGNIATGIWATWYFFHLTNKILPLNPIPCLLPPCFITYLLIHLLSFEGQLFQRAAYILIILMFP